MKKQVIHLMNPNQKTKKQQQQQKRHCLVVKKTTAIIKKNDFMVIFYCLNFLHSTRKKLESHKKVCKNTDFCYAIILSKE